MMSSASSAHVVACCLLLVCSLAWAAVVVDIPSVVANGHAADRSGKFVVEVMQAKSTPALVLGSSSPLRTTIPEVDAAAVLASQSGHDSLLSSSPLSETATALLPSLSSYLPFSKAAASLLVTVPGIGIEDVNAEAMPALAALLSSAAVVELETQAFPRSSVSSLVSLLTGTLPSTHGIASGTWTSANGFRVNAFADASSSAHVASYVTRAAEASRLPLTVVSASYDEALAAAGAVDPRVSSATTTSSVFAWSSSAQAMVGVRGSLALEPALELAALTETLYAQLPKDSPEVAAFVAEHAFLSTLPARLPSSRASLVTLTYSTVAPLLKAFGKGSPVSATVLSIMDATLSAALRSSNSPSSIASLALLGSASATPSPSLTAALAAAVGDKALSASFFESDLPSIFVESGLSKKTMTGLCSALSAAAAEESAQVHCMEGRAVTLLSEVVDSYSPSVNGSAVNGSVTVYNTDLVGIRQAYIWMGVLVALICIAVSIMLATMEYKQDPLLYRTSIGRTKSD